jgi:methyl-accepting chemotaxis protein
MGEPMKRVREIMDDAGVEPVSSDEFRAFSENSPINIMYCDRDLTIRYINPKSRDTLATLEQHLPISVDQMIGSKIDVFHKAPAHQRRLLANRKNLPHRAIIAIGPEKLDLLVSAVYDDRGAYTGAMVTWDVVTEKLRLENEMAKMRSMVENAPINIMLASPDLRLEYLNPASAATLRGLQRYLPRPVDQLVGESIDIFHKAPEAQRRILASDKNLPHSAKIKLGDQTLHLLVTAMYDAKRNYLGPMVTWEVITDRVKLVEDITEAATLLTKSATELDSTATQMAGNSEQTSSRAGSASAASEQVARGVETVATNTEEMLASIKEISRNAHEASSRTNETRTQAQETNATIAKLGASSQEIGNVIKVISSIAQQTNLLALNATIEAARAGDAGRGFAVVANEVKELAKQTATATEEITRKIGAIQTDTGGAVNAITTIGKSIDKLSDIASAIAASVEEQLATTNEVARVVQESNQGVQAIADNIKGVSAAAVHTSSGATLVLQAARDLRQLSDRMQALVKAISL